MLNLHRLRAVHYVSGYVGLLFSESRRILLSGASGMTVKEIDSSLS